MLHDFSFNQIDDQSRALRYRMREIQERFNQWKSVEYDPEVEAYMPEYSRFFIEPPIHNGGEWIIQITRGGVVDGVRKTVHFSTAIPERELASSTDDEIIDFILGGYQSAKNSESTVS